VYWPTLCYKCKWWHTFKQQCRNFQSSLRTKKSWKCSRLFCQDQDQDQDLCFCPRGASRPRPWSRGLHHYDKIETPLRFTEWRHKVCHLVTNIFPTVTRSHTCLWFIHFYIVFTSRRLNVPCLCTAYSWLQCEAADGHRTTSCGLLPAISLHQSDDVTSSFSCQTVMLNVADYKSRLAFRSFVLMRRIDSSECAARGVCDNAIRLNSSDAHRLLAENCSHGLAIHTQIERERERELQVLPKWQTLRYIVCQSLSVMMTRLGMGACFSV